jgi:predicted TPR repeat methyltransferase
MKLLGNDELERSAVVANCRMNRDRRLTGSNGYAKELGFNPLDFLGKRVDLDGQAAWLDLCCGSGKALIEAAERVRTDDMPVEILGVDLVGMFDTPEPGVGLLQLVEASLRTWRPGRSFDLITCVHGLHYVGDKLELIVRAASWLVQGGQFAANLDSANLKVAGEKSDRRLVRDLRRAGLNYHRMKRVLTCEGMKRLDLPYRYLGADDTAGPNYTGQPAVDSYYERMGGAPSTGSAIT